MLDRTPPSPLPSDELRERAYRVYQEGDTALAEAICTQLLAENPRCAEAAYLLAVISLDRGQSDESYARFSQAAQLAPDNAVFVNALGEAHETHGHSEDALACFRQAIALRPAYERAHNNLGLVLHARQDFAAADACFSAAIRLNPRYATAHNNLGAVMQAQGRLEKALEQFQQAIQTRPDYAEAHFNIGTVLEARGDLTGATAHFREAIRIRPSYARAFEHLGHLFEQCGRDYDALACYRSAVSLQPDSANMQRRLGDLLVRKKDWPAALGVLERAVALKPDDPALFASLFWARQQACDWRNYDASVERLWSDAEKRLAAGAATGVIPFQALTLPWPRPRLLAVARRHCDAWVLQNRQLGLSLEIAPPGVAARTGRLRVGYLSGDYRDHPISHLLHGFFGRHDRERFEIFAYSFGLEDDSPYRRRIAAECEHFVDVASLSYPDIARRIAADKIHVLVDLMGHTGVNRLGSLAMRPAPIQVSFLGMLGTMGADFVDYLITDPIVTPPEFASTFTEQFVTLPYSYIIAEPDTIASSPPVNRRAFGLPADAFVYCSFNSAYKVEPRAFDLWMRILSEVPDSVLWLYSAGQVIEENLRREAGTRGIAPERLVFAPLVPRHEHVRRHQAADLFLDSLLYNAAATASLSLQAGLPVLTCQGDTFASRVGASLLTAIGLPELIARDPAEYERMAIELARNPAQLRQLRQSLASAIKTSPLFDTPRFVHNLESAYEEMWENHASNRSPRPIQVIDDFDQSVASPQENRQSSLRIGIDEYRPWDRDW
jgi:protein O-GlcNAc transferase